MAKSASTLIWNYEYQCHGSSRHPLQSCVDRSKGTFLLTYAIYYRIPWKLWWLFAFEITAQISLWLWCRKPLLNSGVRRIQDGPKWTRVHCFPVILSCLNSFFLYLNAIYVSHVNSVMGSFRVEDRVVFVKTPYEYGSWMAERLRKLRKNLGWRSAPSETLCGIGSGNLKRPVRSAIGRSFFCSRSVRTEQAIAAVQQRVENSPETSIQELGMKRTII